MIITCPECATRYDIDEERFLPNGRSVRCTGCGESWYVPAPEPIEELTARHRVPDASPAESVNRTRGEDAAADAPENEDEDDLYADIAVDFDAEGGEEDDPDAFDFAEFDLDDDADDSLFGPPPASPDPEPAPAASRPDAGPAFAEAHARAAGDAKPDPRPFFARRRAAAEEKPAPGAAAAPEARPRAERASDGAPRPDDATGPRAFRNEGPRAKAGIEAGLEPDLEEDVAPAGEATIVDADFEDLDGEAGDGASDGAGFGRRVREQRRRATALARMEDVRRFEPQMFDEEFFAALQVTPRELERAVRKARRRAEARDKNRLTPWRALGWAAWVAAIAGAAYAVVVYRDEIVRIAPSAADAYAVVGIETEPFGLKIENVRHRLAMSTSGPIIEITGSLRNAGDEAEPAPLLQAEALGPRGELLSRWTFSPEAQTVEAAGVVAFTTRNPAPEGVAEVALSIAPAGRATIRPATGD